MRELNFGCKLFTPEQQQKLISSLEESRKLRKKRPPSWREIRDFLEWAEVRVIAALSLGLVIKGAVNVDWLGKNAEFQMSDKGKYDYQMLLKDFLNN